jgi:hypothetical protein
MQAEANKSTPDAGRFPPIAADAVEEDSGLHDIRALAQATKQRRAVTAVPAQDDEQIVAAAANLRAVALPEPARMVVLPALGPAAALAEPAALAPAAATAVTAVAEGKPFIAPPAKATSGGTALLVGGGSLLVAGVAAYLVLRPAASTSAPESPPAVPAPAVAQPPAPVIAVTPQPVAVAPAPAVAPIAAGVPGDKAEDKAIDRSGGKDKSDVKPGAGAPKVESRPVATEPAVPAAPSRDGTVPVSGEKSVDDLLREAGGEPAPTVKVEAKATTDKKEFTAGDIRNAMSPLTGQAQLRSLTWFWKPTPA